MQSAQTRPSITNKSPTDLILSIKWRGGAICQRRDVRLELSQQRAAFHPQVILYSMSKTPPRPHSTVKLQAPVELSCARHQQWRRL